MVFTEKEKNNIFMKFSIDEDILNYKILNNKILVFDNPKDAILKAYGIDIDNITSTEAGKNLILSLVQLEAIDYIGLDSHLTLADAFIAFHNKTCRASDGKFILFLD